MIKKLILLLGIWIGAFCAIARTGYPYIYMKPNIDASGLSDVKDLRMGEPVCGTNGLYSMPSVVNMRYEHGRMYVVGNQCYAKVQNFFDGYFHNDNEGNPVIEWGPGSQPTRAYSSPTRYFFDFSFNCKAEGTAFFQIQLRSNKDEEGVAYAEIPLEEYTNVSFRLDGIYPALFDRSHEWLYGKVARGSLTGEFAVEKFDGEKVINDKSYRVLKRCDGDVYNPDEAYEIAYIRYDGIRLLMLPVDNELPLDMWCSGLEGTVNPRDVLGNEEIPILDVYNVTTVMTFKDVPMNRLDVRIPMGINHMFDEYGRLVAELAMNAIQGDRRFSYKFIRWVNLNNNINMVEGIGMLGDCVNSFAYPSMIGDGDSSKGVQKLIRMSDVESGRDMYLDKDLYAQYLEMTSEVDLIASDPVSGLNFSNGKLSWQSEYPVLVRVISIDGMIIKEIAIAGAGEISLADIPKGIYIVRLAKGNGEISRKIKI